MLVFDKLTQSIYEEWFTVITSGLNKIKGHVVNGEITVYDLMQVDAAINILKAFMRGCENSEEYRDMVRWFQHQSEFLKEEKARKEKRDGKSNIVTARISGDVTFEIPCEGDVIVNAEGDLEEKSKIVTALIISGGITLEIPDEGDIVVNTEGNLEGKSKKKTKQAQIISGGIIFEIPNERR